MAALCTAVIFATIPLARSLQKLVYSTIGKEFFTYAVFFIICVSFAAAFYFLFFKYRIRNNSQYVWLFICAGIYIYYTAALREHPEEAVHFIEYGLLAYFFFRALSAKIRDRTIYLTVILFVSFVGTLDEFIQWMLPERVWDYRDIGLNTFSGAVLMFAVWRGIRPEIISGPVRKISIKIFCWILAANLIFLGLCLANTPCMVKKYTSVFESLAWLRDEEPMTEFRLFQAYPSAEETDCADE